MLTALAILAALLLVALPGVVTLLKGQFLIFVIGVVLIGLVWVVAAFRLARPDSWWAQRFYDDAKLRRARERYGETPAASSLPGTSAGD
jgi:hypothetical protein